MRYFLLLILLFIGAQSHAQYAEWLRSDRGGQGIGPFTVGENTLQVEAGWSYVDQERKLYNSLMEGNVVTNQTTKNLYQARFRLGISERIEASAGINYIFEKNIFEELSRTRMDDYIQGFDVALRGNIYKGKGAIPAMGLEVKGAFVKEDRHREQVKVNAILAFRSAFTEKFSLSANVGLGDDLRLTLAAAYQFTDRLSAFLEYDPKFSGTYFLSPDYFQYARAFANGGVAYNINRNFQLDMATTFILDQSNNERKISDYFGFQVGLTGRLNWRH